MSAAQLSRYCGCGYLGWGWFDLDLGCCGCLQWPATVGKMVLPLSFGAVVGTLLLRGALAEGVGGVQVRFLGAGWAFLSGPWPLGCGLVWCGQRELGEPVGGSLGCVRAQQWGVGTGAVVCACQPGGWRGPDHWVWSVGWDRNWRSGGWPARCAGAGWPDRHLGSWVWAVWPDRYLGS